MKKILVCLALLTSCGQQTIIPPGDPGRVTVHMQLVKLSEGKNDTPQYIIYLLSNDSDHDYYLPNWVLRSRVKFNYSKSDTSLYDLRYLTSGFLLSNRMTSKVTSSEDWESQCHLLGLPRLGYIGFDSMRFKKMQHELNVKHVRQIFRQNASLTKKERKRIKQELLVHSENDFILLKAGTKKIAGISTDLSNLQNNQLLQNSLRKDSTLFITYMPINKFIKRDSSYVFAEEIHEPLMLTSLDINSLKETPKIWYYDPKPYPKYKSYYPYLGEITCPDTIVIHSGCLLD